MADLDAIERAAADWRATYAEPLIAGVTPGRPTVVDSATAERGKAEFDHLRAYSTHRTNIWQLHGKQASMTSIACAHGATGCWWR